MFSQQGAVCLTENTRSQRPTYLSIQDVGYRHSVTFDEDRVHESHYPNEDLYS